MCTLTKTECIERARAHLARIEELTTLIGDKRSLTRAEKEDAQEQMRAIKDALEEDRQTYDSVRRRAEMNDEDLRQVRASTRLLARPKSGAKPQYGRILARR